MTSLRVSIIPAQAVTDQRLTALDVRVLAIIGRQQQENGFLRLNRREIAEFAQCCERSVPRSVSKMEGLGYIERRQDFEGKVQAANQYRVKLDQPLPFEQQRGDTEDTPKKSGRGDSDDTHHISSKNSPVTLSVVVRGDTQDTGVMEDTGCHSPHTPLVSLPSKRVPKGTPKGFPLFDELWAAWRERDVIRRAKRKPAFDTFERLVRGGADPQRILAGARAYLADPEKTREGGRFMPDLFRWLRDEVWADWGSDASIDWAAAERIFREHGYWNRAANGPAPDEPGYRGLSRAHKTGTLL